MARILLSITIVMFWSVLTFGQACESERYKKAVFSQTTVTEDLVFSTADIYDPLNIPLEFDFRLDVYEPAGDTRAKRPLVIMQFGGAYIFGNKEHADVATWCDSLARYGYVAVSMNYRLGVNALSAGSATRAMYRGVQDTRAAIRYMVEHADIYRIDPTQIYLGGESAGAINSLHTAFINTEQERPQDTYGILLENFDLGCLDCSGNNFQHNFEIKGVIDLWGGVLDTAYIEPNQDIPTLIIHGEEDFIVPHEDGYPFLNEFQLTFPFLYTALSLKERMDNLGIYNEMYIYPGEGHLFYGLPEGIITFPNENWEPIWTQGHEFLYKTLEFDSPSPIGDNQVITGQEYVYNVPMVDGSEYCWSVVGGMITDDDNHEITVVWNSSTGDISVTEVNCVGMVGRESELMQVTATSSNQNVLEEWGVQIFPNILSSGEVVSILNPNNVELDISLFNIIGQESIPRTQNDDSHIQLATTQLAKGNYVLVLRNGEEQFSRKIVLK